MCQCPDPPRVGHLPDQEVCDREKWLEDHDGEWGNEPEAQQGDHRDGHWENQVQGDVYNIFSEKKHFVLGVLLSDILIKMSLPLKSENPYRSWIFLVINWFLIFFSRDLQFSGEVVPDKMTIYIQ